jgi:hypothetical protein
MTMMVAMMIVENNNDNDNVMMTAECNGCKTAYYQKLK